MSDRCHKATLFPSKGSKTVLTVAAPDSRSDTYDTEAIFSVSRQTFWRFQQYEKETTRCCRGKRNGRACNGSKRIDLRHLGLLCREQISSGGVSDDLHDLAAVC